MRFIELSHESENIGDDVQTVASSQFAPQISGHVARDRMDAYQGETTAVIMSGWFSHRPEAWPPAPSLTPLFVGFHMSRKTAQAYEAHRDFFKRFEPIGCRDRFTTATVKSWGVQAYTSYCATLTLPRRERTPAAGKVALVDAAEFFIPKPLRRGAVRLTHRLPRTLSPATRRRAARDLLAFYSDAVSLVITTRLHAALPCMAMGIPVVFLGDPEEERLSILPDLGVTINRPIARTGVRRLKSLADRTDWSPPAIDVSVRADALRHDLEQRVARLAA